ncbi:MAG: 4Fe-4S dicluster domain-containing protein, partial [Candidatus Aminicenantes bacterium]
DQNKVIIDLIKEFLEKKYLDAILIPSKIPDTESYTWLLVHEESLLDSANPLPPIMTVQGGKALSSLTEHGELDGTIAVLMRPCEIRAAVELSKLKQIDLDNFAFFSIDCPGAVPLSDYMNDPKEMAEIFEQSLEKWGESESLRPMCQICDQFSLQCLVPSSGQAIPEESENGMPIPDLHIGLIGGTRDKICLLPVTPKGKDLLERAELTVQESLENWETEINRIRDIKREKRSGFHEEWDTKIKGVDNLLTVFDECINCHNCMNACPVCYCQQCYFDSQFMRLTPDDYMGRAKKRGALRFPLDTLFFHLGRMSHMALSCVSCGACEDACPMSIPVAQVFTAVSDQAQEYFHYVPGRARGDILPLQTYQEDEFGDVETPKEQAEMSSVEEKDNV